MGNKPSCDDFINSLPLFKNILSRVGANTKDVWGYHVVPNRYDQRQLKYETLGVMTKFAYNSCAYWLLYHVISGDEKASLYVRQRKLVYNEKYPHMAMALT